MRRYGLLIVVAGLSLALTVLLTQPAARAQTAVSDGPPAIPLSAPPPAQLINGGVWTPTTLTNTLNASNVVPLSLTALDPTDICADAPVLTLSPTRPGDGGQADVRTATESATDPVLSCAWGNPPRSQGYRTVWYKLVAPVNGRVTFDTFGSSYDTVLGVFTGACDALQPVACNDDNNGFSSQISMAVNQGETYYIEVADWQAGLVAEPDLRLAALLEPLETLWDQVQTNPLPPAITRHASVVQGDNLYVIGGQTGEAGIPQISNKLYRLNTRSHAWTTLASIPGAGYANTTAAMVNGRIYLPSGFDGNTSGYDGIHWAYDIADDAWLPAAPIPQGELPFGTAFAWAAAAVPPSNNRYYLTGGLSSTEPFSPTAQVNATTFVYDVASNSWAKLQPMSAPRYGHTAGWVGPKGLCVAGGLSVDAAGTQTILLTNGECYVPGSNWVATGNMVVPRYGAGSAVAPDGRWLVFGGFDAAGRAVSTTEFYDPASNSWRALDMRYDLGGTFSSPPRAWPRGGFVDDDLWVAGGSVINNGEEPLPLLETLRVASQQRYMPFVGTGINDFDRSDDHFGVARRLAFSIPQTRNFDSQLDFYDVYYFDLPQRQEVTLRLEVPTQSQYDVSIYNVNKLLWARGDNPLQDGDEVVTVDLPPGRYYAVVERIFPSDEPDPSRAYRITVTRR